MSDYLPYDKNSDRAWTRLINKLLQTLYLCGNMVLLCSVLVNVYEFCVWKSHEGIKSLNVKDIKRINPDSKSYNDMCMDLYAIRNYTVHSPYKLFSVRNRLLDLLSSEDFKFLLKVSFPEDYEMFDEMLASYSRWIYE